MHRRHQVPQEIWGSVVEGPAVSFHPTHQTLIWKRCPPLCHPDRSVAQWRDLQFPLRLRPVVGGNQLSIVADKQQRSTAIFKLTGKVLPTALIME